MANPELVGFVREQLARFSAEQLRAHLAREGWPPAEVDAALAEATGQEVPRAAEPETEERPGFFDGRITRLSFAVYLLASLALTAIASYFLPRPFGTLTGAAASAVIIAVSIPRIHDLDRSGWWALMLVFPLLNLALLIGLLARPGTDGWNEYGPPPA